MQRTAWWYVENTSYFGSMRIAVMLYKTHSLVPRLSPMRVMWGLGMRLPDVCVWSGMYRRLVVVIAVLECSHSNLMTVSKQ